MGMTIVKHSRLQKLLNYLGDILLIFFYLGDANLFGDSSFDMIIMGVSEWVDATL